MKIGFMNSPFHPLEDEIAFAAENDFDYLELTLAPPCAAVDLVDPGRISEALGRHDLPIPVGHSAWYVPYGNPLPEVGAVRLPSFEKCLALSPHPLFP